MQDIMLVHVLREYNVNKILLSRLGLWPFQSKFIRRLLPIFYLVLEISYYPIEIIMLYDHLEDARMIFECCCQTVLLTIFTLKLLNEFWNHDKIRHLYEAMETHWNIFTSEFEMRILKDYSVLSRKFAIFYPIIMYSALAIFTMIPLTPIFLDIVRPLNESRPRFFAVATEFKLVDQEKYFIPIFCFTMSIVVAGTTIMIGVDTMYVTYTVHACSLFSIIGYVYSQRFEKIISKPDINDKMSKYKCCMNEKFELSSEHVIYQEYIICLQKYQLALEFVDVLNSMFQTLTLILLLLTGATISLVGIRTVYVLDQLEEVMRYSFIIIGMLAQLLIVCYSGQKLLDESQNVFHRAYAAKWYHFSPRLKSLLIITLHRSFVPCGLTAGNMIPLSMTTYATVIRAAISYFTTFLSFKD